MIYDCMNADHIGDRRIRDKKNAYHERRDFRSTDSSDRPLSHQTGVVWCRGCVYRERDRLKEQRSREQAGLFG